MTNISFKRKYLSLLLFVITICYYSSIKAQNRFYEKGYLVTNSGDTINGFIKRVRYNFLYEGIDFKYNIEDTTASKRFIPDSLQSFCFLSDNTIFEQLVYKSINNNNPINKKLFGELMVSGKLKLYRLNINDADNSTVFNSKNDHLYIVKKDTTYSILRLTEKLIESNYYLDKEYIITLGKVMNDCDTLIEKINDLDFTDKDIKNIVVDYNNRMSPNKNIVYYKHSRFKIKQGITASYYFKTNAFPDDNKNYYSVGYFLDILTPSINESISLMTGINYFSYTDPNNKSRSLFTVPLLGTFNLSNKKIAPFLNLGVMVYVFNINPLFNTDFTVDYGVGTYFNNKFFVAANCEKAFGDSHKVESFIPFRINFKVGLKL